jgi:endonuclease G, mitochondrial
MRISELADAQSLAAVERYQSMIGRIRSSEDRILGTADRILGRPAGRPPTAPLARSPADLPDLFLAERVIGATDDIVSIEFLEAGLVAKRPVGRILDGAGSFGTGFLVGLDLVMTAAHCLPSLAEASNHEVQFDYEEQSLGPPKATRSYSLHPERFFYRNDDYDVAIVAATDFTARHPPLSSYGWHVLLPREEKVAPPEPVSIIQHPGGLHKKLVVHNSRFVHCDNDTKDQRYCWYTGDTKKGSSGSPVFNARWEVVALHHRAIPNTSDQGEILGKDGLPAKINPETVRDLDDLADFEDVAFVANQGLRSSRLFSHLSGVLLPDPAQNTLLRELLDLWSAPGAWARSQSTTGASA